MRCGDAAGHDHAPRFGDECAHLVGIDRVEPYANPVEPEVGRVRHQKLVWFAFDECTAQLFRKGKAHDLLVARECDVDDAANPELDPEKLRCELKDLR